MKKNIYSLKENLLIVIVEIVFIVFVYINLFNFNFNSSLILILFFGVGRFVDINGLKYSNGRFRLIYTVVNFFALLIWCMIMFICLIYPIVISDYAIKLSKSKIFLTSMLYTIIYYYNNWKIIKKYNHQPHEYTEMMYEIQSIMLGSFYIIFSALTEDKVTQILFLGPVAIGTIMIIYNKIKKMEDRSNK